jgi:uncharacterized protein YecE (DUF72 family)
MVAQLGLFGGVVEPPSTLPAAAGEAAQLARRLPDLVRFGTSSWTFPGWKGHVFAGDTSMPALVAHGLKAYAAHPLFRAVGVDRSYYGPLTEADLTGYAAQLAPGFPVVCKVWDEVTSFAFPNHPRYGARAGQKNARFLDPSVVKGEILAPYPRAFSENTGPFLFEMPAIPNLSAREADEIVRALDALLAALPETFQYAFELRSPALLTPRYLDTLRAHRAAHVFSFWTGMPDLRTQMSMPGSLTAPFALARVLLPPGVQHDAAKAAFAPFDRIVEPQLAMRRDVSVLAAKCVALGKPLFVLVGNKAEGSAPLTVRALAEAVVARLDASSASPATSRSRAEP